MEEINIFVSNIHIPEKWSISMKMNIGQGEQDVYSSVTLHANFLRNSYVIFAGGARYIAETFRLL